MVSRREIELMILVALGEIRTIEGNLTRRFSALSKTRKKARLDFIVSLQDLESRAGQLERLMEDLDELQPNMKPLAA